METLAVDIENQKVLGMREKLAAYAELTKPRIAFLLVLTSAAAFYLGTKESFDFVLFANSMIAITLLAGLQTIPSSLYEAAEVDGASKWTQFREITLPLLVPSMLVALIFRTLTAIQSFDIPFSMPGPGEETQTLAMYIQLNTVDYLDLGYGSALAVFMFMLSMATTFVYLRYVRGDKD